MTQKSMRGWKTYLAASLSMAWGVGQLILTGGASLNESMQFILGGLAAFGIGHKIQKAAQNNVGFVAR